MVGTYRTDRKPHLTEISLGSSKPTAAVPKGSTRVAYNESGTVVVYQVMDNKAVTVIDSYYHPNDPYEMTRVERHSVIKNVLNVPCSLNHYNHKMGGADAVGFIKSGHYSFENIRTAEWNIKFDEVLLGFYMTRGWTIYRDIHGCDDRENFQLEGIIYFRTTDFLVVQDHPPLRPSPQFPLNQLLPCIALCKLLWGLLVKMEVNRAKDVFLVVVVRNVLVKFQLELVVQTGIAYFVSIFFIQEIVLSHIIAISVI